MIEICSPECRAELGDARCRVDLAGLTTAATATAPKSPAMIAGAMIDAPVVAATVAEPCAMRIAMVTR